LLLIILYIVYTWCDHEVPRMILLHDLRGAMQIYHSKNMSVYVATCTIYDLNALMPVV